MRVNIINSVSSQHRCQVRQVSLRKNEIINFNGKATKVAKTVAGGAAGALAGGAIAGGGTLAGAAAIAATGPIGWAFTAAYAIGGALIGSFLANPDSDDD